jgi:hypothetical protein
LRARRSRRHRDLREAAVEPALKEACMAPSTPEPKRATAAGGAPLRVLVASDAGLRVDNADDVLAVIGAAYDVDALILTAADVAAAFFDLRSGLAGELFQKATQYGVRLALVLPDPALHGPRWPELAYEHRRHAAVRIVGSRAEADAWLVP